MDTYQAGGADPTDFNPPAKIYVWVGTNVNS